MSIKDHKNWLVWKEKHQPTSALTGKTQGWNRSLSTFAEAEQFCLDNAGYQMGLCFSEDLPFVGIDIDDCIGPEGLADWARDVILSLVDNMAIDNKSVSGTGVKLVLRCSEKVKRGVRFIEEKQRGDHKPQIELFSDNKYFALTSPLYIDDAASEVDTALLSEIMGYNVTELDKAEASNAVSGETSPEELADLLGRLDIADYSSREDWLKMLAASHHATGGSEEGYEVFKSWSAADESTFNESDLERDWGSMRSNASRPITVATIVREIAPEDRPRVEPEHDFSRVAPAKTSSRVLGWLLSETARNHAKVVEQLAADKEGESIKYVTDWDTWIVYDGTRWIQDTKGARVHQVVKEYIYSLTARIPDGDAEQAAKASGWVSSLLNYTQTIGVVRQAKGERGLSITLAEMGDRPHLLNFRNGTFDLEADIFRGHSADDFIFYCCDSDYVEGQKSELWERVVSEIFDGDSELIDYVRRIFGNGINGDCSDPIFNIFYGSGANGKSTIVGTINALLSDYSRNLPSELFDKNKDLHPTYLATLRGCRLAVVAELESDVHLAESTIKKVTSTDVIEARRMRQDPFYFKPTHTSVLCTNHLPTIKNSDKGIWRRIKCVPFLVDLSDRKDATIPERLKAELAGVANWLIQGHREYKKHGVGTCKAVEAATASYRDSENEFKRMIEDIFTEADADCKMPVTDALQTYARHGGRLGRKKFVTEMAQLGYIAEKLPYNGSNLRCFTGLRLTLTEFGD